MYSKEQIAVVLDYAVLKPTTSQADVLKAGMLASLNNFASLCVRPCDVVLANTFPIIVSTVIGFPHGGSATKVAEAKQAIKDGAKELDIVLNIARILEGHYEYAANEIKAIAAVSKKAVLKAIIETAYLTPEQITGICQALKATPVAFVKTSTGYAPRGASVEDIETIQAVLEGTGISIKASGGIKTYEDVAKFLDLGCTRIGSGSWETLLP